MKKFLQLFVLSVLSLVAVSMKAQTYNGGVWYSLYDTNDHYNVVVYTNFAEKSLFTPVESMTFEYMKFSLISINGKVELQNKVDGSWKKKGEASYSDYNNYKTSSTIQLDANATNIRYYLASGNGVYVKNHFAKLAKHILFAEGEFGTTSKSHAFGSWHVGEVDSLVVNLRSFLTVGDITITSDNPAFRVGSAENTEAMVWAVGANACASKNGVQGAVAGGGTLGDIDQYSVVIYFCPDYVKDYEGTITLTDGTSTATISVTGSGYVDQKFEQEIVWEQDLAVVNVFDTIVLSAQAKNEITYAVSDSTIASVEGNVLVLHNAGEVEVYAYAAEDVMYLADTLAKTVIVSHLTQEIIWNMDSLVMTVGDTLVLNAVATSGLEVSYLTDVDSVVVIEAGMMVALNPGEVVVTAVQEGNNNYVAAELEYTITVVAAEDDDDDDDVTTGLEDMLDNQVKVCKIIRDGKIYIIRGNQVYDMLGTRL